MDEYEKHQVELTELMRGDLQKYFDESTRQDQRLVKFMKELMKDESNEPTKA